MMFWRSSTSKCFSRRDKTIYSDSSARGWVDDNTRWSLVLKLEWGDSVMSAWFFNRCMLCTVYRNLFGTLTIWFAVTHQINNCEYMIYIVWLLFLLICCQFVGIHSTFMMYIMVILPSYESLEPDSNPGTDSRCIAHPIIHPFLGW